jgi:glycosyltransferase involved in cell wall biosynthesis
MAVVYQELLDLNLVSSAHLKKWMVQHGAESQRIEVCSTNIDTQLWRPDPACRTAVRQELGIDNTVPVVLYAGRMCAQKQPGVLVETLAQLRQRGAFYVALIAGDGPELDRLRSALKRRRVEPQVYLLGAVSNDRIRKLMTAADIFFLPSQWEGISLSIYEAMACGLAVVGADVGGQRELVTPECGVLVARSDEETEARHYAEALTALLQNPQRRREMGQAGRKRVDECFRIEQMGDRIVALLQESIRLHRTLPRPVPGVGLGRACATQAVEYVRLSAVTDWLWLERAQQGSPPGYHLYEGSIDHTRWRAFTYFAIRRWLLPYYRTALDRDMKWLLPLKNKLKRVLLRGGIA